MTKKGDIQQYRKIIFLKMIINFKVFSKFKSLLLRWNKEKNRRQMPWKGEKDPYKIWLSEIILQQTRVEQGMSYYQKFVQQFPIIQQLAKASDKKVFKLWEGLGYYSRCKNLLETARFISKNKKGVFPNTYEEILQLKGVGTYTAAAIASFAYNLPHAVLDGNVFRVLARVFGIDKAIDSTEGKKYFNQIAQELLDKKNPGNYNQALMDFGAIVCRPIAPLCFDCPFQKHCMAYINNAVSELPNKGKKLKIKTRWFYFLVLEYKNKFYIRQRVEKDIWRNLFEFNLIETAKENSTAQIINTAKRNAIIEKGFYDIELVSPKQHQQLSHQKIYGRFIKIKLLKPLLTKEMILVSKKQLTQYAFPKFINDYLKQLQ